MLIGVGLLAGSIVGGVLIGRERARQELDDDLDAQVHIQATALRDFLRSSADIARVLAQNPALGDFYNQPTAREATIADRPEVMQRVNAAIGYVGSLYPERLAEVCFIDRSGAENARVLGGVAASPSSLSPDESTHEFFAPTLELSPGGVYQSHPYVSPDAHDWVVSQSTPVIDRRGVTRGMLHFEITVESFRVQAAEHAGDRRVFLVDVGTGDVVVDSRVVQRERSPLGSPGDRRFESIASSGRNSGLTLVGDQRAAFLHVTQASADRHDWFIVATAPQPGGFGAWSVLQITLTGFALLFVAAWMWAMLLDARRLRRSAETDALTGLPNRGLFHARIAAFLANRGSAEVGAVLMIDLDRFKEVNDTLGHLQGDRLLQMVGARLGRVVDAANVIARLGGDEFGVLLGRLATPAMAIDVVERLRAELERPFTLGAVPVRVGASVGVALIPDHGDDVETLLQHADVAMYEAKTSGCGWAAYDLGHDPYGENHLAFVNELRLAIDDGDLEVFYQPTIDIDSGHVRSVEALVRWRHATRGLLEPAAFLAVAERSGLVQSLTGFVVQQALVDAQRWHGEGAQLPVALNLSEVWLGDTAAVAEIIERFDATVGPSAVIVEITENTVLADRDRTRRCIEQLRARGVRVALDDFGTGYASFVHIKELVVDQIKIDRQFVSAMEHSKVDELLVRGTIALGCSLGIEVVAEGVEDPRSLELLRTWGCTTAQGYLIARPMPIDGLLAWLRTSGRPCLDRPSLDRPSLDRRGPTVASLVADSPRLRDDMLPAAAPASSSILIQSSRWVV